MDTKGNADQAEAEKFGPLSCAAFPEQPFLAVQSGCECSTFESHSILHPLCNCVNGEMQGEAKAEQIVGCAQDSAIAIRP